MKFRYIFYFILILNASCNAKHHEKVSMSKPPKQMLDCVEHLDVGAQIIPVTEQWAKERGALSFYLNDPGFDKWFVSFHDIPDTPPYTFQQKRLFQLDPDRYYPIAGPLSENVLLAKKLNREIGIIISARGYLPGEKIMIRLSGKDAYREIAFYPRPMLLKRKSGELLAKATLLCPKFGDTLYSFDICGVGEEEKYKLVSRSENEILSQDVQGPMSCSLSPEVVGVPKGIAKMEFQFENETYSMEFPWGTELLECKLGNK